MISLFARFRSAAIKRFRSQSQNFRKFWSHQGLSSLIGYSRKIFRDSLWQWGNQISFGNPDIFLNYHASAYFQSRNFVRVISVTGCDQNWEMPFEIARFGRNPKQFSRFCDRKPKYRSSEYGSSVVCIKRGRLHWVPIPVSTGFHCEYEFSSKIQNKHYHEVESIDTNCSWYFVLSRSWWRKLESNFTALPYNGQPIIWEKRQWYIWTPWSVTPVTLISDSGHGRCSK